MTEAPDPPSPPPSSWTSITRVVAFALPHWRSFILVLLLTAVYSGANSVRLLMVGILFDGVVTPVKATGEKSRSQQFFDFLAPIIPGNATLRRESEHFYPVTTFTVTGASFAAGSGSGARATPRDDGQWEVRLENGELNCSERDGAHHVTPFRTLKLVFPEDPGSVDPANFQGGEGVAIVVKGDVNQSGILPVLGVFAALMAVVAVVIAISNFFRVILTQAVVIRTIASIRERIFQHFSTLSLDYFGGSRRGDLISRLTNDVGSIQYSLRYLFGDLILHPMSLFFFLGLAFYASWQLTLIVLPFLPLLVIPMLKSGRRVKKHGRGSLTKLGEVTETFSQFLSGIRVVKAFGLEDAQQVDFEGKNAGFIRSNLKVIRAKSTARSAVEGLYNLLAALVLILGGWLVVGNVFSLNLADFAVFLGAIMSVYHPLKSISRAYNTIQESLAGAERVFEIFGEQPTVTDRPGAEPFARLQEDVRFEGVSFRYQSDDKWVLRDIEFSVQRGQTVAIVGRSGAGKTTLLDLLARFYDVVGGSIRLDGRDLRDGTVSSLLDQIAYVGQDPFLFNSSIGENIRQGRPQATQGEVEDAARAAAIHDEILAMPDGYETVIGDRGMKVSGGQRQRITIARALLKDADILLLDEATSALDTESERKVQGALETLMSGRTTFVIAHRLSTIRHADCILVLEEGRLVERGSHDELLERDGVYARLLKLQEWRDSETEEQL